MSVEAFQAGLRDLERNVGNVREAKAARKKADQEAAARNQLADTFSSTMEGQTGMGQTYAQGVRSGLLSPEKMAGAFMNLPRDRGVLMALEWAQREQDPVKKRIMLEQANYALDLYNRMNEGEAYWKTAGSLRAKGQFGQLKGQGGGGGGGGGSGGGGGGGSGGGNEFITSSGVSGTAGAPGEDPMAKIPYTVRFPDFAQDLTQFLEEDPLYADSSVNDKGDPKSKFGAAIVQQTRWGQEDRQAFRQRLRTFFYNKIREKTPLGQEGLEAYADEYANEAGQAFEQKGLNGFFTTSTKKEGITPAELVVTRDVPVSMMFPVKVNVTNKKGKVTGTKTVYQLNPEAGKATAEKRKNFPAWIRKNMSAKQLGELDKTLATQGAPATQSAATADTDFYLK